MVSEIAGIYIFPAFMATEEYVKKKTKNTIVEKRT